MRENQRLDTVVGMAIAIAMIGGFLWVVITPLLR